LTTEDCAGKRNVNGLLRNGIRSIFPEMSKKVIRGTNTGRILKSKEKSG